MSSLKIVFAGTPEFAARHLQALLGSHHKILAVYTQPDRAAGRGNQLQASPVKQLSEQNNLVVMQPASLKDPETQKKLASFNADLLIVVAYGLILPQAVLDIPRLGCINVHASLLPRWRGAAPIERALLAGDKETGVTIMQMDAGLDTGAMLSKASTPIRADDDRMSVETRLADIGSETLLNCLDRLAELLRNAEQQDDHLSTYARKLDKSEALIDWQQPAEQIGRQIRASIGRSPAYSFLQGERIRLLRAMPLAKSASVQSGAQSEVQSRAQSRDQLGAQSKKQLAPQPGTIVEVTRDTLTVACKDSLLQVSHLQLPGKNVLPVRDVLNSRSALFAAGAKFSDSEENANRSARV